MSIKSLFCLRISHATYEYILKPWRHSKKQAINNWFEKALFLIWPQQCVSFEHSSSLGSWLQFLENTQTAYNRPLCVSKRFLMETCTTLVTSSLSFTCLQLIRMSTPRGDVGAWRISIATKNDKKRRVERIPLDIYFEAKNDIFCSHVLRAARQIRDQFSTVFQGVTSFLRNSHSLGLTFCKLSNSPSHSLSSWPGSGSSAEWFDEFFRA